METKIGKDNFFFFCLKRLGELIGENMRSVKLEWNFDFSKTYHSMLKVFLF